MLPRPGDRAQHSLGGDRGGLGVGLGHDHAVLGRADPAGQVDRPHAAADRDAQLAQRLLGQQVVVALRVSTLASASASGRP